jgi:hypothetical protein
MALTKESDLLPPIGRYARRQGYSTQIPELPFYECRIDLYGHSETSGNTVAVELKLTNWQRALKQALLYQLCADFVYIAMPDKNIARVDQDALSKQGIGLISVSASQCRTILRAERSTELRPHYKLYYVEFLRGKSCHTVAQQSSSASAATPKKNTWRKPGRASMV